MTQANSLPSQLLENDEIDLRQVAAAIGRRRRLIGGVTAAALVLSGIYAFTRKPVWEGQFQIVLADKESPVSGGQALLNQNPGLANLVGLSGGTENTLQTEVKVLESPSVLKPVFDFVKNSREQSGKDVSKLTYKVWLEDNLTINLSKGTSVLNLAYRDTDESIILPVLEKISFQYQSYSGKDRRRGLQQALVYLDEQIKKFKVESVNSLRAAQEYAIEQDLTALQDSDPTPGNNDSDTEIQNNLNLDAIRVQAANEIRNINEQLNQLNALGNDLDALMYMGRNIPELASQGLPQTLDKIDTDLAIFRATYTDNDRTILRLQQRRAVLIDTLRRQTYGYLWARRTAAQARMAAAERPKGVLIKYRELLREATRDSATLAKLEAERQALALEQARQEDPWELISTPTVLDNPIAPRKKRIVALGMFGGLVVGCGAALVRDRRSDLVFSEDELKALLPCPMLKRLPSNDSKQLLDAAQLLAEGPLANAESIAILVVGQVPQQQIEPFSKAMRNALGNRELVVSSDLLETRNTSTQLLITAPGAEQRRNLEQLREQLALQGTPLAGWLLSEPTQTSKTVEA